MNTTKEKDLKNLFLLLLERNGIDKSLFPSDWLYEADNSNLEKIIVLAERMTLNGEMPRSKLDFSDIAKKPLYSIFDAIKQEDKKGFSYSYKVPNQSINLELDNLERVKAQFPTKKESTATFSLQEFKKDISAITSQNVKSTIETYLSILAKHTANLSSNTPFEDVAFYDNFKTVLSISICLYYLDNNDFESVESPILLVGGDISGIQSFIYDIASRKASQNLKGRSFYLQLLSDSILNQLLDNLNLLSANVIYGSGGSFYILAPNTKETKQKIDTFEKEIAKKLFEITQTRLALILGCVPIEKDSLLGKNNENNAWNNLHRKVLEPKKKQKFALQLKENFNTFFEPSDIGGETLRDAITSEELTDKELKAVSNDEDERPLKTTTQKQIDLGNKLKNTDFIVVSNKKIEFSEKQSKNDKNEFEILDNYYYLFSESEFNKQVASFQNSKNNNEKVTFRVLALNNLNFLDSQFKTGNHTYTFEFYGGNDYPVIEVERKGELPKTFSEMAGMKEPDRKYIEEFNELSFKRYAVLRMDIDDLGSIFQNGFVAKKRTFARLSTLSRNLDYFFKGFLNVLWNKGEYNKEKYKEHTQIIYSGGDDLFIVGRWDILLKMAVEIKTFFKEWTCENEFLGISGGIAIVTPKFPIAKAAEEAGDAEKKAKSHEHKLEPSKIVVWEKNSLTLMGIPLHWEHEYLFVQNIKTHITYIYNDVRSTLSKLQGFYQEYEENYLKPLKEQNKKQKNDNNEEGKSISYDWRWQLAYQLARTAERNKNNKILKDFLNDVKVGVFTSTNSNNSLQNAHHDYFTLLNLAIRWAELEHRTNPKSQSK